MRCLNWVRVYKCIVLHISVDLLDSSLTIIFLESSVRRGITKRFRINDMTHYYMVYSLKRCVQQTQPTIGSRSVYPKRTRTEHVGP